MKNNYGKVFGGYSPCKWDSSNRVICDESMKSFVFNISNRTLHKKVNGSDAAILCYRYYGPAFGNWFWRIGNSDGMMDLREKDNCQGDSHMTNGDEYE